MSRHSRTRRTWMKCWRSRASYWRLLSLWVGAATAAGVLVLFCVAGGWLALRWLAGSTACWALCLALSLAAACCALAEGRAGVPPRASASHCQSFKVLANSLFSSSNLACCWSAWACCSKGRSRTSCTDKAAAMTSTSCSAPRVCASSSMRPTRGSSGRRERALPIVVSWRASSTAPISASNW